MYNYPTQTGYLSAVPYYPPRMYQPQAMPQPVEPMAPVQPAGLIKVNGRAGADAYQMGAPNSMVALFDANDDIFYIKSTDGANYPTVRPYRFAALVDEAAGPAPEYVTREEFGEFKTRLEEAIKNVQQLVQRKKPAAAADE